MVFANTQQETIKVGVIGVGALGRAVCEALLNGIDGMTLYGICDPVPQTDLTCPNMSSADLIDACDLIVEALPPHAAKNIAYACIEKQTDLVLISSSILLTDQNLLKSANGSSSRIIVPSGALSGIDGVSSLKNMGIQNASIASTKKPLAYDGAPFILDNAIDLTAITEKTRLFKGNALEAAQGFPANLNVAATLSLAGIGAKRTIVEIWADPDITGNRHEITVQGEFSTITAQIQNIPDPQNPKSSMLAAQSIVATLRNMTAPLAIL